MGLVSKIYGPNGKLRKRSKLDKTLKQGKHKGILKCCPKGMSQKERIKHNNRILKKEKAAAAKKAELIKEFGGMTVALRTFSKEHKENLPASEKWFYSLYTPIPSDKINDPFGNYIPDIYNMKWGYVIEIDGSFHNQPHIQKLDREKDNYYNNCRYHVIRVKPYSMTQFNRAMYILEIIKGYVANPWDDTLTQEMINNYMREETLPSKEVDSIF